MLSLRKRAGTAALMAAAAVMLSATAASQHRYVDPTQAALPQPYYSLERQPWRSFLEVVPAGTYLNGLGVVWTGTPQAMSEAQLAAELAWAGFTRVRIEFPWGAMRWDEGGFQADAALRLTRVLHALQHSHLRPLILLNANDGAPGPMQLSDVRIAADAMPGSHTIVLEGPSAAVVPMYSVAFALGAEGHPGALVTAVAADGRSLTLSRPLAAKLAKGASVRIGRMKYLPLFPVGTPQFAATAAGWQRYVAHVIRFVTQQYGADFDVEVWNELTFGSDFLNVNNYFATPPATPAADFLHAGGSAWELGRQTASEIARLNPRVRTIWGFSNTTFFHTSVDELPSSLAGQSYHPYGVAARCYAPITAARRQYNVGGFIPSGCAIMPEGWAHTFQQTESLMRLLNPQARLTHPPDSPLFLHYITEHGFAPAELGIDDAAAAERAKEKFLVRAPLFWLNKGLSGLYIYSAYDADALQHGMLDSSGGISPALRALHRVVARFQGAAAARSWSTDATVERLDGDTGVYPNDPSGAHVTQANTVAILPFEVTAKKLIVALYVMTENFPAALPGQRYAITLAGVEGRRASIDLYDPLTDSLQPVSSVAAPKGTLGVQLRLTDSPQLLEISLQ